MHLESAEAVRSSVLKQFRELSAEEISRRSSALIKRFLTAVPADWSGRRIALYRSMKYEVQLADLESGLLALGAELCYPKILEENACEVDFETAGGPEAESVSVNEIEVFVVPGLGFGRQGERIGRGKGCYDRILARNSKALRLVLAFDFQLFPSLQQNTWDQRVHWIMTESEEIRLKNL